MATLEERLQNPDYKTWIKAGICLGFAKAGLEVFAAESSKQFHQNVLNQLRAKGNLSCNNVCSLATVRRNKVSCCNNCQSYVDEIDRQNMYTFKFQQGNWDNSNMELWPKDSWEMAKVFMNPGQKAAQRSPVDTDLSGILNFVDHCIVAKRGIVNTKNISKVRDGRNIVMHSASMTLDQKSFADLAGAMINLLEDSGALSTLKEAQEAARKIREVVTADIHITAENEHRILTEKTEVLHLKLRLLYKEVIRMKSENKENENKRKENSETLRSLRITTERNVAEFQEHIDKVRLSENEIRNNIALLNAHLKSAIDIKEEMRVHLRKLDETFESVESALLAVTQEISLIHGRLDILESRSSAQSEQEEVLMRRQISLEHRESVLEEKVQELQLASSGEDFIYDTQELQQCLVEEYKRLGFDVSLSPIYDGLNDEVLKININEIYTDLTISKPGQREEVPLKSYKDIFYTEGKRNRTVFIKGEAGIGKSTWCMKILSAWVRTHDRVGKSREMDHYTASEYTQQELEEAVSQFEFLIFIPLRYINDKKSVKEAIFSSTLERLSNLKSTVQNVMEHCSDSVLILLDGLDEYAFNLCYDGLNRCTVITTTRPWKYDLFCSTNPKHKVDLVLKLEGLDESGMKSLAKKMCMVLNKTTFSACNMGNDTEDTRVQNQVEDFLKCVRHIGLENSVKVPLTLVIMLETFVENGSLAPTETGNLISLLEILVARGERKFPYKETEVLTDLKLKWSKVKLLALADNVVLFDYSGLLQMLAKLAFETVFSSEKERGLIFSETRLKQYLDHDELQVCLKFGLMSKCRLFTSLLGKPTISFSFYHKLVQEFFAALWLVNSEEAINTFKSSVVCISDVLEQGNVFAFTCGLNAHTGSELTKHFVDLCNKDKGIINVRNYSGDLFSVDLWNFSLLILRGQREINVSEPKEPLYVSDICVGFVPDPEISLLKLLTQSVHYLKSMFFYGLSITFRIWPRILELINTAVRLQTLVLEVNCLETNFERFEKIHLDFSSHTFLQNVSLIGQLNLESSMSPCSPLLEALSSATTLQRLELRPNGRMKRCHGLGNIISCLVKLDSLMISNISVTEEDLVVENEHLKALCLKRINLNKACLKLKYIFALEKLLIDNLQMSLTCWTWLFSQLEKQSHLSHLELVGIGRVERDLNLETCRRLKRLSITDLHTPAIRVCNFTSLTCLSLEKVKMPTSSWCHLFSSLRCENMKEVKLIKLDIGTAKLRLGSALQLEILTIASVETSARESMKESELDAQSMMTSFNTTSEVFFDAIPTKSLRLLSLYNLDIAQAEIHFSEDSCLCRLCMEKVKLSKKAFETLRSDLTVLSKLRILDMEELNVEGNQINMTLQDIKTEN